VPYIDSKPAIPRRVWRSVRSAPVLGFAALLAGCTIHSMKTYAPSAGTPETADAATASTNCFEASTPAEHMACATPELAALNRALTQTLQADLRGADMFSRDALLAAQRGWLLSLSATCHLPAATDAPMPPDATSCLAQQFQVQTAALAGWRQPAQLAGGVQPISQYVRFRASPGAQGLNADFCAGLARDANAALASAGTVDPAAMPGAVEIAGSHGQPSGQAGGRRIGVDLREANAFGSFQRRARAVSIDGTPVLTSVALGTLLQANATNNGARFSTYASQTGDYGAADVFSYQGRTVALLSDTWGFDTPAAPGEFAHAGAWDIGATPPAPLCLFDTFQMPAEGGTFDQLPSFTPWRDLLTQLRDSTQPALGVSTLRDQGQLRAETNWLLLNMPLVVIGQAHAGDWTNWLRHRHDGVLDAMFTWSTSDPSHKAIFAQMFALLRPAAADLVRAYQQSQALSGPEAKQAAGLAVMELMYGATVNLAPALGADLHAPASAEGIKPRYPILASPS
jgi:uncharacterized protein YecT (DUF1311 family)